MSGINISNNSWNNWTSSSIQTLFAGFSTSGVNNLASLTNDYSSIKNGSYGKLVKAYYDKEDSSSTKKTSSQDKINQLAQRNVIYIKVFFKWGNYGNTGSPEDIS